MLEQSKGSGNLDINCCDPLGRTALLMAIDNENLEIIEMLIDNKVSYSLIFNIFQETYLFREKLIWHFTIWMFKVETRDALLHAIDEEYVEAVEVLLENEEMTHKEGELHVCMITDILSIFSRRY